ncbi:MAG TPA: NAD(P)-dependent oxidoreductase [Gemmatimonadales bacterium]|nr:NAD(P)-dependent oxidoreductase [Gemmatimonadales bacterium]
MRALVTGATGFVGGHLVEALLRARVEVTALVRSPDKAALLARLGVRQIQGDLHNPAALREAAQDQNVIYHVAGAVAAKDEAAFLKANREGTENLVAAASRGGRGQSPPRLVVVSSLAAGGPATRGQPRVGDEPANPVTAYGRSKLAAENVVRRSSLPWTIVRPPMVYGPRDTEVLKVFRLCRTGIAPVFGDGRQEISAVYAPDLAEALVAVTDRETTVGGVFYACHAETCTTAEFVRTVGASIGRKVTVVPLPRWLAASALGVTETAARLTGRSTILTRDKANEFFQDAWTADAGPLADHTSWKPSRSLEEGLRATAAWYREQGWL